MKVHLTKSDDRYTYSCSLKGADGKLCTEMRVVPGRRASLPHPDGCMSLPISLLGELMINNLPVEVCGPCLRRSGAKSDRAKDEDRVAAQIAAWVEENPHGNSSVESSMLADDIREGAWRE